MGLGHPPPSVLRWWDVVWAKHTEPESPRRNFCPSSSWATLFTPANFKPFLKWLPSGRTSPGALLNSQFSAQFPAWVGEGAGEGIFPSFPAQILVSSPPFGPDVSRLFSWFLSFRLGSARRATIPLLPCPWPPPRKQTEAEAVMD